MKNFTIYNAVGEILRTGIVPDTDYDLQILNSEEYIIEESADPEKDLVDPQTKKILRNSVQKKEKVLTYADKRAPLYPSITEQLDMLWRAMDKGILPKDNEFYSTIKLIKDQYPKDTTVLPINPIIPKAL